MSITTRVRRGLVTVVAGALATSGIVALAGAPAQAAEKDIAGVSLTWSLSNEQGGGAFFGGCNFLSAGKAGNTESSRLWTEADGFYRAVDGNVSVEKPNASGTYVAPTWADKCKDKNGTNVSAGNTASTSGNRVKLSAGAGSIDPATGAGTISWTGSFTSVFYGGLTYWSATDPTLEIAADGTGTLTATASGFGASMENPDLWSPLEEREITLADFTDANFSGAGNLTATPTYLGTAVETDATPQVAKSEANTAYWGSFPQSFVDFQYATGQSSYWYTSGGARDVAKPATPVNVQGPAPAVTVSKTTLLPNGTQTVTVNGTGFDPAAAIGTRPPFSGKQSGAYIAFGRYADNWRPSQPGSGGRNNPTGDNGNGAAVKWAVPLASFPGGPPAQDPTSPAYTELRPDGSFTTEIKVNQSWLADKEGNFGIYTYAGGGPVVAAFETYTPITFEKQGTTTTVSGLPSTATPGAELTADVTVEGDDATPTGSVIAYDGEDEIAQGDLAAGVTAIDLPALSTGDHDLTFTYEGDGNSTGSSSASKEITVAKGATTTTVSGVAASSPYGAARTATVKVTGASPTGTVTAKIGSSVVGTGTLKDTGVATIVIRNNINPAPNRPVVYSYPGDAKNQASSVTKTLTVTPATVGITDKVTKTPTSKKTGKVTITVASKASALKPVGKVKVSFKKSGKSTKATGTGTLSSGVRSLTVPKLAKGTWKMYVKYTAGTGYTSVSSVYVGTVKVTK